MLPCTSSTNSVDLKASISRPSVDDSATTRHRMSGRLQQIVRHNSDTFGKLGWYSIALFIAGVGSFFLFGRGPIAGESFPACAGTAVIVHSSPFSKRDWVLLCSRTYFEQQHQGRHWVSKDLHCSGHQARGACCCCSTVSRLRRLPYSAIAGVLATNLVIALYVKSAFAEDQNSPAPGERIAAGGGAGGRPKNE